jgi:hypothetical protein
MSIECSQFPSLGKIADIHIYPRAAKHRLLLAADLPQNERVRAPPSGSRNSKVWSDIVRDSSSARRVPRSILMERYMRCSRQSCQNEAVLMTIDIKLQARVRMHDRKPVALRHETRLQTPDMIGNFVKLSFKIRTRTEHSRDGWVLA